MLSKLKKLSKPARGKTEDDLFKIEPSFGNTGRATASPFDPRISTERQQSLNNSLTLDDSLTKLNISKGRSNMDNSMDSSGQHRFHQKMHSSNESDDRRPQRRANTASNDRGQPINRAGSFDSPKLTDVYHRSSSTSSGEPRKVNRRSNIDNAQFQYHPQQNNAPVQRRSNIDYIEEINGKSARRGSNESNRSGRRGSNESNRSGVDHRGHGALGAIIEQQPRAQPRGRSGSHGGADAHKGSNDAMKHQSHQKSYSFGGEGAHTPRSSSNVGRNAPQLPKVVQPPAEAPVHKPSRRASMPNSTGANNFSRDGGNYPGAPATYSREKNSGSYSHSETNHHQRFNSDPKSHRHSNGSDASSILYLTSSYVHDIPFVPSDYKPHEIDQLIVRLKKYGLAAANEGKWKESHDLLFDALQIQRRFKSNDYIDLSHTLHHLGLTLSTQRRTGPALEVLSEALELRKYAFGNNNLDVAATYHTMGVIKGKANDYVGAVQSLGEAEAIQRRVMGHGDEVTLRLLNDYSRALEQNQRGG